LEKEKKNPQDPYYPCTKTYVDDYPGLMFNREKTTPKNKESAMKVIDRNRLKGLISQEQARFVADHPVSQELFKRAKLHLLDGVPMSWMVDWAGTFPMFIEQASGAHILDVDGKNYLDLCLGDTGAMTGHVPGASTEAIIQQLRRGTTFMLPTEDAIWIGEELDRRFGLPFWQVALTATDANRFAIRLARYITGRDQILVFNGCYHGTVDESFIVLQNGKAVSRPGNAGPPVDPTITTRVVEFNDIPALETALGSGKVACVLAEPALTNIGIVLPEPGYHQALREITRRTGTLLIIDETHTISTGPGGYTQAYGLQPDMLTLGKPIGSGIPAAVYGFSTEVANRISTAMQKEEGLLLGIGGTLAGNALSLAAMRATFEHVLTEQAFKHIISLAKRYVAGVESVIEAFELAWQITRLGCRAEYWFQDTRPRNGSEALASYDSELARYMHLATLNRGVLLTPFHNMALMAPDLAEADIDFHTRIFSEVVEALVSP
jgi:glutamate-1-semialdehyde 2,1-aminomutase